MPIDNIPTRTLRDVFANLPNVDPSEVVGAELTKGLPDVAAAVIDLIVSAGDKPVLANSDRLLVLDSAAGLTLKSTTVVDFSLGLVIDGGNF